MEYDEWEERANWYIHLLTIPGMPSLMYEITRAINMLIEYCPNKRVKHLIKYGKNINVRRKNIRRALKIIAKGAQK